MRTSEKIFKTLDEQIDILLSKGIIIEDIDKAKITLFRENYFFINGYRHVFMQSRSDSHFIAGTSFNELYSMFLFDRKVRNIMFKYILMIENNVKSILSYQLSKQYGYKEKDYLNPKNFTQDSLKTRQVHDIISKMKRQIRVNSKQHAATLHYLNKYGYIPMWILVKVLSFGIISELFAILKDDDQTKISETYDLDIETLSIYLSLLANYRNICAHEEVLYSNRSMKSIPDCKYHYLLGIDMVDNEYAYGKNDLYAVIIIMKQMLLNYEFTELINEISYEVDILNGRIKTIPTSNILNACGFPDNWKELDHI